MRMDWKPIVIMGAVVVMYAVMNALTKTVFNEGIRTTVLMVLRLLVAALFLAPIAYFKERKSRPKLTIEIFVYFFFSALLGASLVQWFFYLGIRYTTAIVRERLQQHDPHVHLPPRARLQAREARRGQPLGRRQAHRHGRGAGRSNGAGALPRPGPDRGAVGAPPSRCRPTRRRAEVGYRVSGAAGLLGELVVMVHPAVQDRHKVPGALLQHGVQMALIRFVQMAAVGAATEKMTLKV